jgi:hypothetical protein
MAHDRGRPWLHAGYGGITPDKCEAKGCCYVPAMPTTGAAFMELPICFYKNAGDSSYALSSPLQTSGKHPRLYWRNVTIKLRCVIVLGHTCDCDALHEY